jgi:hypothetical protein
MVQIEPPMKTPSTTRNIGTDASLAWVLRVRKLGRVAAFPLAAAPVALSRADEVAMNDLSPGQNRAGAAHAEPTLNLFKN